MVTILERYMYTYLPYSLDLELWEMVVRNCVAENIIIITIIR